MAKSRWHRDVEVSDLIEHLDHPSRYEMPEALTASEQRAILKEIDRCRKDFIYAARNYFWISNKKLGDQLFTLWPSQELILQKILELKAKKMPQKLVIIKARQLGALDPGTPVLTSDLRWVPISSLNPGDQLVATDEFPQGRCARKFRSATVLRKWSVTKEAFRIVFDNGKSIIATADHPFLCKKRGGLDTAWVTVKKCVAMKSRSPIVPGDQVRYITDTWSSKPDFEDGWFSGLLDGEGSLRAKDNGGVELSVSQVAGPVLERAAGYLSAHGYGYRVEVDTRKGGDTSKIGNRPVYKLVLGRAADVFRLLGTTRPSRFSGRTPWEGKKLPKGADDPAWATVLEVESVGEQTMVDIETTTKTFIANGFVTHNCSTLIEALIAWRTMFFSNVNALVVSKDINHAAYALWPIMLLIYDRMPWWLQPMSSMRKAEEGMVFENPKYETRRQNPGLLSRIYVKGANSQGVGQGIRLSAVHVSEFADFEDGIAKEIIDEDMVNALVEDEGTFAILESTAKGANRYAHKLWKRCVELGAENAEWEPVFLPFFFEATRIRPIAPDFRLDPTDVRMRDRVLSEWLRCEYPPCLQYHMRFIRGEDREGITCPTCHSGTLTPYRITDEQLHWIQHRRRNAKKDDESMKKLLQEMACSAEEAFVVTGYQIFGNKAQDFANSCVREPIAFGDFDKSGRVHGCNPKRKADRDKLGYFPCFQEECAVDHTYDENPLQIWEWPAPGSTYCIGADVAEGLGGKNDYSVGVAIRYTQTGGNDAQVATWRSNTIEPIEFAAKLYHLGMFFNEAQLAVECNKYDICIGTLRFQLNYPNTYRWKHLDSVNIMSTKLGWWTDCKSRPRLWQTFRSWLNQELFSPRSRNLIEEMKNFVKDDPDAIYGGADMAEHDDELIACMISLYTAQEGNYNEALGMAVPKTELNRQNAQYIITCQNCRHEWLEAKADNLAINPQTFRPDMDANKRVLNAGGMRCPACGSRMVEIERNTGAMRVPRTDSDDVLSMLGTTELWTPDAELNAAVIQDYDLL